MVNGTKSFDPRCLPLLWILQIAISLGFPIALALFSVIFIRVRSTIKSLTHKNDASPKKIVLKHHFFIKLQIYAIKSLGGKNLFGRCFIVIRLVTIISSGAIFIYIIYREKYEDSILSDYSDQVFFCIPWRDDYLLVIDFSLQVVFLFHYVLSILASDDILKTIISMSSLIDYLTIIPQILMFIFQLHNYGFRFVTFLRLNSTATILLRLNIITEHRRIALFKLIFTFMSVWLTGAGLYLLLDSLGDDFNPLPSRRELSYFDSMYFLIITMSTVGYGEFYPMALPSRLFMIFFVIYAISLFASFIPELATLITLGNRYGDSYKRRYGQRHIVVCGHISYRSVVHFIKDFYHKDRSYFIKNIKIVFLSEGTPDERLETILIRKWTKIKYLQGQVSNPSDLKRAKVAYADSVIILSDLSSENHEATDWSNIMQVIAIKQIEPAIQVIVQILEYKNKSLLQCIPEWDPSRDFGPDKAVCMTELTMSVLGQSALIPGFSTFFTNCLTYLKPSLKKVQVNNWEKEYIFGASNCMFSVPFSGFFNNLTFREAVGICYRDLEVVLVAIIWKRFKKQINKVEINPDENLRISVSCMMAIVICSSDEHAKKVEHYCPMCHSTFGHPGSKRQMDCSCSDTMKVSWIHSKLKTYMVQIQRNFDRKVPSSYHVKESTCPVMDCPREHGTATKDMALDIRDPPYSDPNDDTLDTHINMDNDKDFPSSILSPRQVQEMNFISHIIVCLLVKDSSKSINITPLIMILRSRQLTETGIKDIVIIGDVECLQLEWITLKNVPNLYLVQVSPLNDVLLEIINVDQCFSCLIIGRNNNLTMTDADDFNLMDRETILCTLNIRKHLKKNELTGRVAHKVFLLTEINFECNHSYIYPDKCVNIELRFGFTTGAVFNRSNLNTLMSTIYFNPSALTFFETLLTGGVHKQIDGIINDNLGLVRSNSEEVKIKEHWCPMNLLSIHNPQIQLPTKAILFEDLFKGLLDRHGFVTLGLYRLIGSEHSNSRFVYTLPSWNTVLRDSDMVYFLDKNIDI